MTFGPEDRWYAEVTYAMQDGDLLPIDVHVRLLPPGVALDQVQNHKDYVHLQGRVESVENLGPIPAGGLSQRQLCGVPLAGLASRWRDAARFTLKSRAKLSVDLTPYADGAQRKPGRPPSTPIGERLRVLAAIEEGFADGQSLDDVANYLHMSRSSLRDLLSWARNDAEPLLFTNPGRGKRGGRMTPEAREMQAQLSKQGARRG